MLALCRREVSGLRSSGFGCSSNKNMSASTACSPCGEDRCPKPKDRCAQRDHCADQSCRDSGRKEKKEKKKKKLVQFYSFVQQYDVSFKTMTCIRTILRHFLGVLVFKLWLPIVV